MDIENGTNNSSDYFRAMLINGNEDITEATPLIKNEGIITADNSAFKQNRNGNDGAVIRYGVKR